MWQRFKGFFNREDEPEKTSQQRAKPKPRQDWLVAVGQGHSPARTLRRESRGGSSKPRRKKFDTARLSFGGLEQEEQEPRRPQSPLPADDGTDARQPCSPPATPSPRLRRNRPDFSHSYAASRRHPATAAATSPRPPAGDDSASDRGGGSPSRRSPAQAPPSPQEGQKTDWLSAAVSRRGGNRNSSSSSSGGERGADALAASAGTNDDGVSGSGSPADAKLNSLLVLSPGKEYWAGRLAAKGPRDGSESPRRSARKTAVGKSRAPAGVDTALSSPREVSPLKYPAKKERNTALRYAGRQQQQEGSRGNVASSVGSLAGNEKEFSSFTAGKKGAPLSAGCGGGGTGSAWSAQASPRGSPGGGRGRADPSPWRALQKGEVWSPSTRQVSPSTLSWSPAKGQRRRDFNPASTRLAREDAPAPAPAAAGAGAAGAGAAYHPATTKNGGATSSSLSPAGVGPSFRATSSARFSPRKEPVGASFGGGGRSASPLQTQVSRDSANSPWPGSPSGGYGGSRGRPLARARVTSPPSSLPTGGIFKGFGRSSGSGGGSVRDSGSPERTMKAPGSKRESPERTGEITSSDDDAGGAGAAKGQEPGGAAVSGGEARLVVEDPDKSEEGAAVKPRTSRRKTAAAAKREERKALVLPPATEKNFIGFLPEEFCAPFRLLFQLFAVAGWP